MILTGTAFYTHIQEPSPDTIKIKETGKTKKIERLYITNLIIEDKVANQLEKAGYIVKTINKDIPGIDEPIGRRYVKIKCNPCYPDGNLAPRPACVDAQKNAFGGKIGNGSKINVQYDPIKYNDMTTGEPRISARLKGIQVVELREVGVKGADEFEEVEGFVAAVEPTTDTLDDVVNEIADDNLEF